MRTDIFVYVNEAGAECWADPVAIERRFRTIAQEDPRKLFHDLMGKEPDLAMAAASRIPAAACYAFELGPPLDKTTGQGVTEAVWLDCLGRWCSYMEKNVFGGSTLPTCSVPSPESPLLTAAGSSA